MADDSEKEVMDKVRALFEKSGLTLHDLGVKMGFDPTVARQSVFQFMKTNNPALASLRRFSKARGIPIRKLIE
jgi:transcriptional regulator with XRE-family HTH domain